MNAIKKLTLALIVSFAIFTTFAQYKMRPVNELLNFKNPGWTIVKKWIDSAKNEVEILPVDTAKANDALYKTQVTIKSAMGAIVYNTGGLLVDHGWIRILGSGSAKMQRSLPDWNKGKAFKEFGDRPKFFLVADDAGGGYFAINYGSFGKDLEKVYYLAPDDLTWDPLNMTYEDFLLFCFNDSLDKFYKGIRWKSWKKDVQSMSADQIFHVMPPMWSKEGKDIEKSSKTPVPVDEQFSFDLDMQKSMGLDKGK